MVARLFDWLSRLLDPPRTYESVLAELSAGLKDGSIVLDVQPTAAMRKETDAASTITFDHGPAAAILPGLSGDEVE